MDSSRNELLLCGSGLPAFAHIGVLKALSERGVKISTITGSSTSALVAALHANGSSSSGIQNLFLNRDTLRFNSADWLGVRSGCQATPRMFRPIVDLKPVAEAFVRANGLKPTAGLRIVCYDLLGKQPVVFAGTNYDLATALAAACAVPGISRPIRTGRFLLVDIATHEWAFEAFCGKEAIVSRALYAGAQPPESETIVLATQTPADPQAKLVAPKVAAKPTPGIRSVQPEQFTQLDRWLDQRRHMLRVDESAMSDGCEREHLIITTQLFPQEGCACAGPDDARVAVVDAGYQAAVRRLE